MKPTENASFLMVLNTEDRSTYRFVSDASQPWAVARLSLEGKPTYIYSRHETKRQALAKRARMIRSYGGSV